MSGQTEEEIDEAIRLGALDRRGVNERTACYKCYDASDRLIYVGITKNTEQRFWQHSKTHSWWWRLVARREVAWHKSRPDALFAERLTVIAVLRESKATMPEAEAIQSRQYAVAFATRVGWSKYQIAEQIDLAVDDVVPLMVTERRGDPW